MLATAIAANVRDYAVAVVRDCVDTMDSRAHHDAALLCLSTASMVLIEHDMDLALGLVDRVTVMHEGCVLAEAAPADIRGDARVQEVYLGTPHRVLAAAAC